MTATLPAQLLYIAAQFATTDDCKQVLTAINVKRSEDAITIVSTDGHRAFRVSFDVNEHYHMDEEEITIHAAAFKKRIAKARYVRISDNTAEFKDVNGMMLSINPVVNVAGNYPSFNQIWPDTYVNNPGGPIAFNVTYLSTFLNEVARFGVNGTAKMELNTPTTPMQYSASIEAFSDAFEVYYLLMPVQIRK
jgi:DNA polymerase III sliding clamp (beta) subunit (PCNA family)